jgi:hypothetical protein
MRLIVRDKERNRNSKVTEMGFKKRARSEKGSVKRRLQDAVDENWCRNVLRSLILL